MNTVYTVAFSSGRFLMVYNPKRKGWEMPGGRIEENESVTDAAEREFMEESGYAVDIVSHKAADGCCVCAAVLGDRVKEGEFSSELFSELPNELAFERSEYEGVIEWAQNTVGTCDREN